MTEHLSEKEMPSLEKSEDADPSDMIKVTIDEENEEESSLEHGSSAVNQIEKNANSSQIMASSLIFQSSIVVFSMITTMVAVQYL